MEPTGSNQSLPDGRGSSDCLPALDMALWITPTGAARPEEILAALGLVPLLEAGAVLERSHLEILDEVPEHERFVPEIAMDLAADASAYAGASADIPEPPSETTNDGSQREGERPRSNAPTPLLPNPLSFDS